MTSNPAAVAHPATSSEDIKDGASQDIHSLKETERVPDGQIDLEKSVSEEHSPNVAAPQEQKDPNIVDWDGPDDPTSPRNWTSRAKACNAGLVIVLCVITPLASSMFAPGVPDVLKTFHNDSETLAEFVVSIYILGFAVGPLLISPASEIYGRWVVYLVCNILFLIFTVACAVSQSLTQLIIFRFFAGCVGVCPVTLGGASISDLIAQEKRGASMALFGMGPLMGPVIGPVAGAYLSARVGWRWTFWVIAIAFGVCTILHFFLCKETYAPTLLERKTQRLRKETNNPALRAQTDDGLSNRTRITRAFVRPFKLLVLSPIVSLMALYVAVVYGILYLLFTTFTFVFEEYYGISAQNVGLTYIASGLGMFIGLFLIGGLSDRILKKKAAQSPTGELRPEYRLIILMYSAWTIPAGLFIYGWTVESHQQWAVPLFGTLVFGVGLIAALICVQQYLIDAFTRYAASAIAANTVLRSIIGGVLPLCGLEMYDALGLGWGNSLLGFISLALIPIPVAFYFYGERIRKSRPLNL